MFTLPRGHLSKLFGGPIHWTDVWKGFGALAGAYVFARLRLADLRGQGASFQLPICPAGSDGRRNTPLIA